MAMVDVDCATDVVKKKNPSFIEYGIRGRRVGACV
jgi:hypothetical protein